MAHPMLSLPRRALALAALLVAGIAAGPALAGGWDASGERPPRLGQFVYTAPNAPGINYLLPPGQKAVPWNEPASTQMQQMGQPVPASARTADEQACAARHRSYDPASGLYRASDGHWKPCP